MTGILLELLDKCSNYVMAGILLKLLAHLFGLLIYTKDHLTILLITQKIVD